MYFQTYDDYIPAYYDSNTSRFWYDCLPEDSLKVPVYNSNSQIWSCPSEPQHDSSHRKGAVVGWTPPVDYAINSYAAPLASSTAKYYRKIFNIKSPSQTFILCDAYYYFTSTDAPMHEHRHNKGLNMLFFDIHCERKPYPISASCGDYPWRYY